jgi:hypothetical protein
MLQLLDGTRLFSTNAALNFLFDQDNDVAGDEVNLPFLDKTHKNNIANVF